MKNKKALFFLVSLVLILIGCGSWYYLKPPTVSIVMPVYNGEKYLDKTIRFLLLSTYSDFEFIVIDDGSTDGSYQKLLQLAEEDRRIKVYKNPENMGISKTRNRGFELARGKYIAPMDQDDWSLPERLELSVKYLNAHPEVDLVDVGTIEMKEYYQGIKIERAGVLSYMYKTAENEQALLTPEEIDENIKISLFFSVAVPTQSAAMMRKSFFERHPDVRYRPNIKYGDDYRLYVDMIKAGAHFHHIPDIAHIYNNIRTHSDSFVQTQIKEINTIKSELYEWAGLSFDNYLNMEVEEFACTFLKDIRETNKKLKRFTQALLEKNYQNLCMK